MSTNQVCEDFLSCTLTYLLTFAIVNVWISMLILSATTIAGLIDRRALWIASIIAIVSGAAVAAAVVS